LHPTDKNLLVWWGPAAVLAIGGFLWGNFLLGVTVGFANFFIVMGLAIVGYSNVYKRPNLKLRWIIGGLFAATCLAIMATPATFSPGLQHAIEKQATDRRARAELAALFDRDDDYSNLSVTTKHFKVVAITIQGVVPNQDVYERLLADLEKTECNQSCVFHVEVTTQNTQASSVTK